MPQKFKMAEKAENSHLSAKSNTKSQAIYRVIVALLLKKQKNTCPTGVVQIKSMVECSTLWKMD